MCLFFYRNTAGVNKKKITVASGKYLFVKSYESLLHVKGMLLEKERKCVKKSLRRDSYQWSLECCVLFVKPKEIKPNE